jgi:hypothetical protein
MSDRLALANAIEEALISAQGAVTADATVVRAKAERVASVIFDAIHENVATKADLQSLETRLSGDLQNMETRLSAEIARIADRTLIRLSGVMVVLLGIVLAALKWHQP